MTRDEIIRQAVINIKEGKMREAPKLTSLDQLKNLSNDDLALWIDQELPWAVMHMRHGIGSKKHLDDAAQWIVAALNEATSRIKSK